MSLRALLCTLLLLCACDEQGPVLARRPAPVRADQVPDRAGTVTRSLLDEAGRAELDADGLLIDLGAPDQHKYVRRSWERTWGAAGADGSTTFLRAASGARLRFHSRLPFVRLVLRARSATAGQRCTFWVNGKPLRPFSVPRDWAEVEAVVADAPGPGSLALELRFDRPEGAELDWVWLARRRGAVPPLERVDVVRLDEARRALVAAPPRSYGFSLVVPAAAWLSFAYGSRGPARFRVVGVVDGAPPVPLFERRASDGRWRTARIDLARLAGRAARLELSTEGEGEGGWGEPELVSPAPAVPRRAAGGPPASNLVHVLVDAARQQAYPAFNKRSRIPSPGLDRLAREGTTFVNAVTPSNWTYPSVATLLSGRYHFSFLRDTFPHPVPIAKEVPLLHERLDEQGFATAAFVANRAWINAQLGTGRSWGTLRSFASEVPGGGDARRLFDAALAWLDELRRTAPRRRFYIYVHTMEPHAPYRFHRGFTERFLPGGTPPAAEKLREAESHEETLVTPTAAQAALLKALYSGEVAYHEHHLARFLDELARRKLLGETLVVHTNDHGEELLDHGGVYHGHTLYEELTRCPMVLRFPPVFLAGGRSLERVELVDLVPTILETLGLPPIPGTHGRSLVPDPERVESGAMAYAISVGRNARPRGPGSDNPLPQTRAVWFGPYKLIVHHRQETELYDLSRDPGERHNLAATHPVAVRAGEILLLEAIAVPARDRRLSSMESGRLDETPAPAPLTPTLRRRLRALGYIND